MKARNVSGTPFTKITFHGRALVILKKFRISDLPNYRVMLQYLITNAFQMPTVAQAA